MVEFGGRILMVGFGSVAQCTLPILLRELRISPKQITVMDFENKRKDLAPYIAQGVRFVRARITPENLGALLGKHLKNGDVLIDLAWNIDCCEILQWCHDRGVLYINTSLELWDPYAGAKDKHPTERTLYFRHLKVRDLKARWKTPGPTAVVEHGANPGLISHWTKRGLLDIAAHGLARKKFKGQVREQICDAVHTRAFNRLAMNLGVKVIHVSERDTQVSDRPKEVGEFVNTWSIEGFREEGITTSEMGWGTHEKTLPDRAFRHLRGPKNQICLARAGMNTRVRSWVPDYSIEGMVVRHGEAFTITDHLTVWKNGRPVYRPTVHYAYCCCDAAQVSLQELRANNYELQSNLRIMTDEITGGADILGALIMGHPFQSWWTGSRLSIEQSRRLVPHQNATTMQVACSVVAAVCWMMENSEEGVNTPDDLPHDYILKIADPYLGDNLSVPSDWTPLKNRKNEFGKYAKEDLDRRDPWQFKNFLIRD
ncbi:MAG: homospermidine synthase [Kiritimatiellae bacterium]|nr:homospermidine synthase [Kiritimatiellia bacterium]